MNVASLWAQHLLKEPERFVIIDTETTGLTNFDEIIQVSMIDGLGNILVDELVEPTCEIKPGATAAHHITIEDVMGKPAFFEVLPSLQYYWKACTIVMYNAAFDYRMLRQSAAVWGAKIGHSFTQVQCAMEMYAVFIGETVKYVNEDSEWEKSYRKQKLGHGGTHAASDDCLATLEVIKEISRV